MSRVTSYARDGLVFDVTDAGPPEGEPVVLLHGFPTDRTSWDQVAPLLHAHGLRTLAPDQRGYSAGARPPSAGRVADRLVDAAPGGDAPRVANPGPGKTVVVHGGVPAAMAPRAAAVTGFGAVVAPVRSARRGSRALRGENA